MYSGTNESDQIVRLVLSGSVFFSEGVGTGIGGTIEVHLGSSV